jgi:hypothetical protein
MGEAVGKMGSRVYVNAKMIPVDTIAGMGAKGIKERVNSSIFDML